MSLSIAISFAAAGHGNASVAGRLPGKGVPEISDLAEGQLFGQTANSQTRTTLSILRLAFLFYC